MKKNKVLISTIILAICILFMPIFSYATNEEIVIVENSSEEYLIYIKPYLTKEFEFAFSNDSAVDVSTLTFYNSALDNIEEGANNIAYVDSTTISMFANKTYIWVKVDGELNVTAIEVNIQDNITKTELENVGKTSTVIPIKLEQQEIVNEVNDEGTKITETVGVVKLLNEITDSKYQLIERNASEETDTLFALAELIEKNEFTDSYTQIKASKEYIELYNKIYSGLKEEDWKTVENSSIQQPVEAKTGDQYIIFVKGDNVQDIHFLTSLREYNEEFIKEEIKTKLPYTYDNNTILIALGIVVVAIILVSIRISFLKKQEENK